MANAFPIDPSLPFTAELCLVRGDAINLVFLAQVPTPATADLPVKEQVFEPISWFGWDGKAQARDQVDGSVKFNDALAVSLNQEADITQPGAGEITVTALASDNTEIFAGSWDLEVEQSIDANATRRTILAGPVQVAGDITPP